MINALVVNVSLHGRHIVTRSLCPIHVAWHPVANILIHSFHLLDNLSCRSRWVIEWAPSVGRLIKKLLLALLLLELLHRIVKGNGLVLHQLLQTVVARRIDTQRLLLRDQLGVDFSTPSCENLHGLIYVALGFSVNCFIDSLIELSVFHFESTNG